MLKKILKSIIPPVIYSKIFKDNADICQSEIVNNLKYTVPYIMSYSQYNEDLLLDAILNYKKEGFYIDIGANDPVKLNNTKRFYDRGWHGINIEPDPNQFKILCETRKKDINLNCGVGSDRSVLKFYQMSVSAISSFDKKSTIINGFIHGAKLVNTLEIQVYPLSYILDKYARHNAIDFISIDVESWELEVIKSNDWTLFRPKLLLIEMHSNTKRIIKYLKSQKFFLIYFNGTNGIFIDSNLFLKEK